MRVVHPKAGTSRVFEKFLLVPRTLPLCLRGKWGIFVTLEHETETRWLEKAPIYCVFEGGKWVEKAWYCGEKDSQTLSEEPRMSEF